MVLEQERLSADVALRTYVLLGLGFEETVGVS